MTLTSEPDLERVKVNQQAKYQGHWSLSLLSNCPDTQTHTGLNTDYWLQTWTIKQVHTECCIKSRPDQWTNTFLLTYLLYSTPDHRQTITNKLAPYGTDGQLLLTANFKVTW